MKGGLNYWASNYLREWWARKSLRSATRSSTVHVIFSICDHYEPRHKMSQIGQDVQRVAYWEKEYVALFNECLRDYGHGPRHTWFYPPHHGLEHLATLNRLAMQGSGEIELHLHHDNDDENSFRVLMSGVTKEYHKRGVLLTSGTDPRSSFSFIHGDWALCNSHPEGRYCGVNNELTLLQEFGCWGDFTMPSANECQTRKINSIYYAQDTSNMPKSHDSGIDLKVGKQAPSNGFFMMQGPLGINFSAPRYPRIENSNLTTENWGRKDRIKAWLDSHIHVRGRPEWVFIKLHAHGAVERDFDGLLGDRARAMHKMLNEEYNDGVKYQLHYATAREMYNICKAAEVGLVGNPSQYRDYFLAPYAHVYYHCSATHCLEYADAHAIKVSSIDDSDDNVDVKLMIAKGMVSYVQGHFIGVDWNETQKTLVIYLGKDDRRRLRVDLRFGGLDVVQGASASTLHHGTDGGLCLELVPGADKLELYFK